MRQAGLEAALDLDAGLFRQTAQAFQFVVPLVIILFRFQALNWCGASVPEGGQWLQNEPRAGNFRRLQVLEFLLLAKGGEGWRSRSRFSSVVGPVPWLVWDRCILS